MASTVAAVCIGLKTPISFDPAEADAAIIEAWNNRDRALAVIHSRGPVQATELHSPAEADVWDLADDAIINPNASSLRGALMQAWVAWAYTGSLITKEDRTLHNLILDRDFEAIDRMRDDLDWEHVCMLQIVRTLSTLLAETL